MSNSDSDIDIYFHIDKSTFATSQYENMTDVPYQAPQKSAKKPKKPGYSLHKYSESKVEFMAEITDYIFCFLKENDANSEPSISSRLLVCKFKFKNTEIDLNMFGLIPYLHS